jgi:hypothetical protein
MKSTNDKIMDGFAEKIKEAQDEAKYGPSEAKLRTALRQTESHMTIVAIWMIAIWVLQGALLAAAITCVCIPTVRMTGCFLFTALGASVLFGVPKSVIGVLIGYYSSLKDLIKKIDGK